MLVGTLLVNKTSVVDSVVSRPSFFGWIFSIITIYFSILLYIIVINIGQIVNRDVIFMTRQFPL